MRKDISRLSTQALSGTAFLELEPGFVCCRCCLYWWYEALSFESRRSYTKIRKARSLRWGAEEDSGGTVYRYLKRAPGITTNIVTGDAVCSHSCVVPVPCFRTRGRRNQIFEAYVDDQLCSVKREGERERAGRLSLAWVDSPAAVVV